jgi:HlyD family secretion protein
MKENLSSTSIEAKGARRAGSAGSMLRRCLPYVGLAGVVVLITAGLWPRPVPAEIASVSMGPLRTVVSEEGKTRIRQRYTVSAPVGGQLRRFPLKPGAVVLSNETVVATIDPVTPPVLDARSRGMAEARRDAASASVGKYRASHDFAARELKRLEGLFQQQTISIQDLERARLAEASAAEELKAGEGALRQIDAELIEFSRFPARVVAPVEVRAPASGRVLRVFEENSRVVSSGTPLLEIGDPTDLEVVVEVLSRDGASILPGTRIEFEQWGGTGPLQGTVRLVEPAAFTKISALGVEEQRVRLVADLTTPPEQRPTLGDNFRVDARVITWETERGMKIPSGALFHIGNSAGVFLVEGSRARLRQVKVGHSSGAEVQVLEGVKEGDEVIIYPGNRIKEGQRVSRIGS